MLCFTIDSRYLCSLATAFLEQNSTRHSTVRLSSGEGEWVQALPSPLRFGILNPSYVPEIKHKRTVMQGVAIDTDTDRLRIGI